MREGERKGEREERKGERGERGTVRSKEKI